MLYYFWEPLGLCFHGASGAIGLFCRVRTEVSRKAPVQHCIYQTIRLSYLGCDFRPLLLLGEVSLQPGANQWGAARKGSGREWRQIFYLKMNARRTLVTLRGPQQYA